MVFRDVTSIVIGTTVMLIALFGVLFFMSTQCFAPSDPRTASLLPTATRAAAQGGADAPTRVASSNDGSTTATPPRTATPPPVATPVATATPPPAPTQAPPPPTQLPSAAATANFSGNWRVIDTVTQGAGTGQSFTFDVTLVQNGSALSGGNSGIVISGSVSGETATASYTQPALGISGTFIWTLAGGAGSGTFTSSVPNAGTSQLVRR